MSNVLMLGQCVSVLAQCVTSVCRLSVLAQCFKSVCSFIVFLQCYQHLAKFLEDYLSPIVMDPIWVKSADIVAPARACTAFECTYFFVP